VTIESLAAGGAGVAHLPDGMTVFVPRTAPGDRVALTAVRRRRRHAEARIGELVAAGPDRVAPVCRHYIADRCGGCQWQHVSIEAQARAKQRVVGDALRRIGGLALDEPALVTSPRALGYRSAITLTVRWSGGRTPVVGFHDDVDPDRVFPLERCDIAREEVNALWAAVRGAAGQLPRGDDVRLKLRVEADGALHVLVSGGEGAWMNGEALAAAARDRALAATVWWQPEHGAVRRVAGPEADAAGVAFGQVNPEVAARLHADVVESAATQRRRDGEMERTGEHIRILDLYAGAGETAVPLAAAGHELVLVEVDARAVRRAEERAAAAGVTMRCLAGRVEDKLPKLLPADVVIVNPPRSGLSPEVSSLLSPLSSLLVYVSCDPATLARDLKRIGVRTEDVRLVRAYDMFPQTSHVETLVVAERA
jgi:23S rRNA (uracil1939-C5)-methyltransferase